MATTEELVRTGGSIERKGFAADELEVTGETAGQILAAQARAMVEARFIMAMRRPRDWDDVRTKLLRACERPGFAGDKDPKAKVWGAAWYKKPVGDGVEGFSIRFAEEAMRCMGNLDVQTVTIYDDREKRILTVTVTDLEANVALPTSIIVAKTVERKKLKDGQECLGTRLNSYGDVVYIIPATEDDVFQKQQSLASKAIRNGVLRLLPGDIQAECRTRILEIRFGDAAKDPDKVRREVSDAFAKLNVMPSGLKQYLGHDLIESTPAELVALRELYKAINAGEVTWADALAAQFADSEEPSLVNNGKDKAANLAAQLKAEREAKGTEPPPPAAESIPEDPPSRKERKKTSAPPPDPSGEPSESEKLRIKVEECCEAFSQRELGNPYNVIELVAGEEIRKVAKIPEDKLAAVVEALTERLKAKG